jgi:hypothetical protein
VTIRRVNHGRGHSYVDTDTGQKIPGVTTVTKNGIPKPALNEWMVSTTIDYALDNWDALTRKPLSVRAKELAKARYAERDAAGNKGTAIHKLAERLVQGERVAVPDELADHVRSYVRFLDEFDVQPILVERPVILHKYGVCGTFDLIADLIDPDDPEPDPDLRRRETWLLDLKSSRSGVFGETALQLAPYRFADAWLDDDGTEHDMPIVDRAGAIHIRADGYDLIPLDVDEERLRDFLYVQQVARIVAESRDWVGEPITSPTTSTYRLTRDES